MARRSLPFARVRRLLRLQAELYEFRDPAEARRHLVDGLLALVGARVGVLTLLDDFRPGGTVRMFDFVASGFTSEHERDRLLGAYASATADPGVIEMAKRTRRLATKRRRDVVDDRAWYASDFVNDVRFANGLDDVIYVNRVIADGFSVGIGMNRDHDARAFGETDRDLLALFSTESPWLYRPISVGGAATWRELSRRDRETLDALLAGWSEKEAAARLGMSAHTLHVYVKRLYRRFEVRSRAELTALFVPRSPPRR